MYDHDGLRTHHNHQFMLSSWFQRSYRRGVKAAGEYKWYWRVHMGIWAAATAAKVRGDFVECGVNRGFMASAILESLQWEALGKFFYLFDTFAGLNVDQVSKTEIERGVLERNLLQMEEGFYTSDSVGVFENFSEWSRIRIISGSVPESLLGANIPEVAFLHIDMNCAFPEVAAVRHFWDRMSVGGIVLLDDYAYFGYESQKEAMDELACEIGFKVASLPTGQGLVVKT